MVQASPGFDPHAVDDTRDTTDALVARIRAALRDAFGMRVGEQSFVMVKPEVTVGGGVQYRASVGGAAEAAGLIGCGETLRAALTTLLASAEARVRGQRGAR